MMDICEFIRQIFCVPEGEDASKLMIVLAFGVTRVVGFGIGMWRARTIRRVHAAAAAYAERVLAQHRRFDEPSSVRLRSQPDRAPFHISFIDSNLRAHLVE
jgi:hypothetical protein